MYEGYSIKGTYLTVEGPIGIVVSVFANGLGDRRSIPGRVIPKTKEMVLDTFLLNTQHCNVFIKGKVLVV